MSNRGKDVIAETANERRQAHALEHKRLARARTLEMLAQDKIAALPDSPKAREMKRRLFAVSNELRQQERAHEAGL
jgi:hypothetical protein